METPWWVGPGILLLMVLGGIWLISHRTYQNDERKCEAENKRLTAEAAQQRLDAIEERKRQEAREDARDKDRMVLAKALLEGQFKREGELPCLTETTCDLDGIGKVSNKFDSRCNARGGSGHEAQSNQPTATVQNPAVAMTGEAWAALLSQRTTVNVDDGNAAGNQQ